EHRLEQRLLAGEVVVHGAAGHPAGRRHVLERRPGVATLGEQRGRAVQQRGPGGRRVHLTAARAVLHTLSVVTYTAYVTITVSGLARQICETDLPARSSQTQFHQ